MLVELVFAINSHLWLKATQLFTLPFMQFIVEKQMKSSRRVSNSCELHFAVRRQIIQISFAVSCGATDSIGAGEKKKKRCD